MRIIKRLAWLLKQRELHKVYQGKDLLPFAKHHCVEAAYFCWNHKKRHLITKRKNSKHSYNLTKRPQFLNKFWRNYWEQLVAKKMKMNKSPNQVFISHIIYIFFLILKFRNFLILLSKTKCWYFVFCSCSCNSLVFPSIVMNLYKRNQCS